jgi:two-component system chemotaxis response regulator CheY
VKAEPLCILTVDDSASMRALLMNSLTQRGHKVIQAEDGIDALELLDRSDEEIDIIVTDINMPRMDGFKLIKSLREQEKYLDIPIVVLSTENSAPKEARAAGATGWVVKPFDADQLEISLRKLTH